MSRSTYRFQGSALKIEATCGFYLVIVEQLIGSSPIVRYHMVYSTPNVMSSATFGEKYTGSRIGKIVSDSYILH